MKRCLTTVSEKKANYDLEKTDKHENSHFLTPLSFTLDVEISMSTFLVCGFDFTSALIHDSIVCKVTKVSKKVEFHSPYLSTISIPVF